MPDSLSTPGKTTTRSQLLALIDRMSQDMQLDLLRYLESKLPKHIKGDLFAEKRVELRRLCLINVTYRIDGRSHSGFILDISAFGVFIESDSPFDIGQLIELDFTLPRPTQAYHTRAKIVWSGSQGFGAQFLSLTPQQVKQIKSFSEEKSSVYTILS